MKGIFLDIDGVLNDMLTRGVMHWNSTFVNNYFLKKRLVQTKSLHELTNENINEAIEMLK